MTLCLLSPSQRYIQNYLFAFGNLPSCSKVDSCALTTLFFVQSDNLFRQD